MRRSEPAPSVDERDAEGARWLEQDGDAPAGPWLGAYAWARRDDPRRYVGLGTYAERVADHVAVVADDGDPTPVRDDVRAAAPQRPRLAAATVAPAGDPATWRAALAATPDVGAFWNPAPWPVCCARLATLALVNPTRGELAAQETACGPLDDAAFDPSAAAAWREGIAGLRDGRRDEIGMNFFHCRSCGAVYGVATHT